MHLPGPNPCSIRWGRKQNAAVAPADVQRATFQNADGALTFQRDLEGGWEQVLGVDETDMERFNPTRVQTTVSGISRLRATNFGAPDLTPAAAGLDTPVASVALFVQSTPEPPPSPQVPEGEEPPPPPPAPEPGPAINILLNVGQESSDKGEGC